MGRQTVGLVGLGVMGANLARNIEAHGSRVCLYNRTYETALEFMEHYGEGHDFLVAPTLRELVGHLQRPRRIILMVPAGRPTDAVIQQLVPLLEPGDMLVDGGNAHFRDTDRHADELGQLGLRFVGMGVSGGEVGALHGPSLMPGCAADAYAELEGLLSQIAAQTDSGPCVTHVGPRGSGHFAKMVHNGIEYGDMQLICEAYDLLRRGLGLTPPELAAVFDEWNRGELSSYLIEITARIVSFPDDRGGDGVLIDHIADRAQQKGTGRWTTQVALDLGVPIPTITAAVDARQLSALKAERVAAEEVYGKPQPATSLGDRFVEDVRAALYAAKICSYAQGFALLSAASSEFGYHMPLAELARIWKAGCIIRAQFLDRVREAYQAQPQLPNLLISPSFREEVASRASRWRRVIAQAVACGIPVPAMSASMAYFDGYTSSRLPANLLQAQRDYFGAHTYERIDAEGVFHTRWQE
ncbi:MAG TPA: NADP-dependent phosphogluconate dehydrogenase [Armatimonadota bacterium]|nr:NADP-dependent phosphogluconate dehydrogenase [Armatimonadota bacterium]